MAGQKSTAAEANAKVKEVAGTAEFLRLLPKPFAVLKAVDPKNRTVTLLLDGETVAKVWPVEPDAEVDSRGDCDLAFQLEKRAFGAGEPIEGTLVLTPSADCKVNEVRVELEREENVPRGKGNEERVREAQAIVAGEVELTPGLPIEYPFRLEVPPDPVATLQTDQSTVRWRLKGIGSRRMRRDYDVAQELYVYSAPGAHLG